MLKQFEIIEAKSFLPIVPVFKYENKPTVPWKNEINWIKDKEQLINQEEIFQYFNKNNELKKGKITGSALITGKSSNIMVLDLDRNHGDSKRDGVEVYKQMVENLGMTEDEKQQAFNTFTVRTPNGGLHLYFKYREGLKNGSNSDLSIDIRTDGGIIITPGSLRSIDNEIREYTVYKDNPIYDIPIPLFGKLNEYFGVNKSSMGDSKEVKNKPGRPPKNKEYYTVTNEGERDNALIRYLGKIITQPMFRNARELLPLAKMYNQCYINPPLDEQQVQQKVNSILSYANPTYCTDKGKIINGSLLNMYLASRHHM